MKDTVTVMEEMKPSLHLSAKVLPEIKKWEVGKTYSMIVKAKQVSLSQDEYDGQKTTRARFEIVSIKPVKSNPSEYSTGAVKFAREIDK